MQTEIPTLGSMDNAGNSVNPRCPHYPFTLGMGFPYLHQRAMIGSICINNWTETQACHGQGKIYGK